MIILGIDPGRGGGVAVLSADNENARLRCEPSVFKLDQEEDAIADLFWKIYYDANGAADWCCAVLEIVHAMPATKIERDRQAAPNLSKQFLGRYDNQFVRQLEAAGVGTTTKIMQGSVGTFTFGQNYGFLRGCLRTVGIPFLDVRPQDWQTALGCRTRGDKNVSKRRAQELFPGLKVTHWNADALLLGEFGRRSHRSWVPQMAPVNGPIFDVGAGKLSIQTGDVPF